LQEERRADGADQRYQTRSPSQRAIGQPLQEDPGKEGHCHTDYEGNQDDQDRIGIKMTGPVQPCEGEVAGHSPNHEYLAVSEVDHKQDAIDQGVSQRNQCIH